jgi:CRP-like cAMP-binding protein
MTPPPDHSPLELLGRVPCFAALPPERLARVAEATLSRRYPAGALIMQKGDRPAALCIVASGKVKETCQSSEGDERVIEILGPTQTCGETALLLDDALPFSVVALTDALLLQIDKATILALIAAEPPFARSMLSTLSARIHALMIDMEAYALHAPIERVAGYLVEQAADRADATVLLPAAKAVVASRLGMTPEALSRAFRDLADAGLVEMRGQRVVVLNPVRLRQMAQ